MESECERFLKNWDLDIKNPKTKIKEVQFSTQEIINGLKLSIETSNKILSDLKN